VEPYKAEVGFITDGIGFWRCSDLVSKQINKTIVITGATSGIGFATAKLLAGCGAYVVGTGRSRERCNKAEKTIKSLYPEAKICFITADLSSLSEISGLAAAICERLHADSFDHLDVLVNNAGTVSSWYVSTEDGFELQFAVNHLAPFKLSFELMPLLERSKEGIIIGVSSGSHYRTRINWKDVQLRKHYNCLWAYKQSKLANVLFATEMNRRHKRNGSSIRAFAVDPGLVNTDIGLKGTSGFVSGFWKMRSRGGTEPEKPADTIAYLASDTFPRQSDEVYWKDSTPLKPSKYSQREDAGERLWELSERMCGIRYE
jgi:NAD(P)-dependent dehydrogenase (short-subunit alcohol dehydrogenase family)